MRRTLLWLVLATGVLILCGIALAVYVQSRDTALLGMRAAYVARSWPAALLAAQRYLDDHPSHAEAARIAAHSLCGLQRWLEADRYFRVARDSLDETDLWAWTEALTRLERWSEALEPMSQLYERAPNAPRVLRQMAVISAQAGQAAGALKLAEQLASHAEHRALAYGLMGSIYQGQQRYAEAARVMGQALELDPEGKTLPLQAAEIKTAMGWNLVQVGDTAGAIPHLEAAAEADPRNAMAAWLMGKAKLALGDQTGAYAWWIESLRRNRHNPDALLSLGTLAMEQGRFEHAADWLELAAREAPENSQPQHALGNAYVRLGLVDTGKEYLAWAEQCRQRELAESNRDLVVQSTPESALGLIARADRAARAGQLPLAASLLEQAVEKYNDARARDLLQRLRQSVTSGGAAPAAPR
jgi:tetratricopeptide (TPR) repeat protein